MEKKKSKWKNFKGMIDRANPLLTILAAVIIFSLAISNQLLRREVVELRQIIRNKNELLVELKATQVAPRANGVVITYAGNSEQSLVVEGLSPLGTGQEYRVWRFLGKEALAVKSFSVDQQGKAWVPLNLPEERSNKERLGVSLESAKDNPSPEGPVVLLSPHWRR